MTSAGLTSLHVSDSSVHGGAEEVFRATVAAASDLGHAVHTFVGDDVRVTPWGYLWSARVRREFGRLLARLRPDVVHLHNYYHRLSPSLLGAIVDWRRDGGRGRVVFSAHDYHLVCPNSGFQSFGRGRRKTLPIDRQPPLFARYDERSLAHAALKSAQHALGYRLLGVQRAIDRIVSPSHTLRRVFTAQGVAQPVDVVRNPIDLPGAIPPPRGGRPVGPRAEGSPLRLVYAGRVAPEKGLVELVRSLARGVRPVSLDVYGTGPDETRLRRAATATGVSVLLHGRVPRDRLAADLPGFDAFVYPSVWLENAPLALLEAAAAGLPLIVPLGGGAEEMARESRVWHGYDPADPVGRLDAVLRVLGGRPRNELIDPDRFSAATYAAALDRCYAAVRGDRGRIDASVSTRSAGDEPAAG